MPDVDILKPKELAANKTPAYEAHSYDHQSLKITSADKEIYGFLIKEQNKSYGPKFTLAVLPDQNDGLQRIQFFISGEILDDRIQASRWVGSVSTFPSDISLAGRNKEILLQIKKVLCEKLIQEHKGVPVEFNGEVKKQLQKVPLPILENIVQSNYRMILLERLDKIVENTTQNLTGKSSTPSMAYVSGFTNPINNQIFIGSKVINSEHEEMSTVPILGRLVAHEIGHVVSDLIAEKSVGKYQNREASLINEFGISSSTKFRDAYILDCSRNTSKYDLLEEGTKERAQYYLESGHKASKYFVSSSAQDRAMKECFAESFSTLLIGNKESFEGTYFLDLFPESVEATRQIVNTYYGLDLVEDGVTVDDMVMPKINK